MSSTQTNNPEFITESELAERWRVTKRTIRNWRYAGTIPQPMKVGRDNRYRLADIVEHENKLLGEGHEQHQ